MLLSSGNRTRVYEGKISVSKDWIPLDSFLTSSYFAHPPTFSQKVKIFFLTLLVRLFILSQSYIDSHKKTPAFYHLCAVQVLVNISFIYLSLITTRTISRGPEFNKIIKQESVLNNAIKARIVRAQTTAIKPELDFIRKNA